MLEGAADRAERRQKQRGLLLAAAMAAGGLPRSSSQQYDGQSCAASRPWPPPPTGDRQTGETSSGAPPAIASVEATSGGSEHAHCCERPQAACTASLLCATVSGTRARPCGDPCSPSFDP